MRVFSFITILTLLIAFISCKDNNTGESEETEISQDSIAPAPKLEAVPVYTWVDKLRLRSSPGSQSEILMEFPEGTTLYFLGEKSDKIEKVTLRGETFEEPWLKVGTADGTQGWVYGGAVRFNAPKLDKSPAPYDACFRVMFEKGYTEFDKCAQKVRKQQLKKDQRYVTQLGKGLSINLLNGETKVLKPTATTNEITDEGFSAYEYMNYIPQMGFFVVGAMGHEFYEYQLINDKSGSSVSVWGYPKPSPDFRHLVVANADLEAGFTANGIQVLGFTDKGFKLLWEEELEDMEPNLPKWLDEKTVEITLRSPETVEEQIEKTITLKIENGKLIKID